MWYRKQKGQWYGRLDMVRTSSGLGLTWVHGGRLPTNLGLWSDTPNREARQDEYREHC